MVKNSEITVAQERESVPAPQDYFYLFVAINAKYVHTNLAVRSLSKNCRVRSKIAEYSINDDILAICGDIYKTGIKHIMFSCYIWNISYVLKIASILKKADSDITICLGGPEVSFCAEKLLSKNDFIDYILCGEGKSLSDKLADIIANEKGTGKIIRSEHEEDMNNLVFPYENEDMSLLKDRIIYYETQRGCPFSCSFCLSGKDSKVRYLDLYRVQKELDFFIKENVPLVKFVDRTFNSNPKRALEIINYIKQNNKNTTFHFEIKAEIMTDALIESLKTAPPGMFQVEIGVQSTDDETLRKISRKADTKRIAEVVKSLRENNNVHLHLDLIAGLPGESLESFINSFNHTFAMRPHDLQLGFLKKLHGAQLDDSKSQFLDFPPYEVISSDKMTYDDILMLKSTADVLERYSNSGSFTETLDYILKNYYRDNPFDFFCSLGKFFDENGIGAASKKSLFELLKKYCDKMFSDDEITHCLARDWCLRYRDNLSFTKNGDELKSRAFDFLQNPENTNRYFKHYEDKKPTKLYKQLRFSEIGGRIYVFDYMKNVYHDVTELI